MISDRLNHPMINKPHSLLDRYHIFKEKYKINYTCTLYDMKFEYMPLILHMFILFSLYIEIQCL